MSDSDIVAFFMAYYSVGFIFALSDSLIVFLGMMHAKKHHPELLQLMPTTAHYLKIMLMLFLAWPVVAMDLIHNIQLAREKIECARRGKKDD